MITTKIMGTGSFLPEQAVTNEELSRLMDTSDEWIRSRTGIRERRIAVRESTSHMAILAAQKALESAGILAEELDIIVVATSSPDQHFPSTACEVQKAIGAIYGAAYDISAACSGFLFALNTVHGFFKAGIYQTGLVIGVDALSRLVDWTDRSTCVLFGDGAGAAVVQAKDTGIRHMIMRSDGRRGQVLECKLPVGGNLLTKAAGETGYIAMDGQAVFKFAVKTVPECIKQLLEESHTKISQIKYFMLHQANCRIIEAVAKRLEVSPELFPTNLEWYGNTSGASIPVLLDEWNRAGKLQRGDLLVLAGFGAGLTWGATLLEW